MNIIFLLFSLLGGVIASLQGVINSAGANEIGLPTMLAFFSIVQAIPAIIFILVKRPTFGLVGSLQKGWKWFLISGLFGATIVTVMTLSIAKIGALTAFVVVVLGQIIASAIADHFGFLGIEVKKLTPLKVVSILIIFAGVSLLVISDSMSDAAFSFEVINILL